MDVYMYMIIVSFSLCICIKWHQNKKTSDYCPLIFLTKHSDSSPGGISKANTKEKIIKENLSY